jgi:hypothetical protein
MKHTHTETELVRSFCARVINLCYEVESACTLTDITSLQLIARSLRKESEVVQSIYGGHPAKLEKSVAKAPVEKRSAVKKKKR